jgi:hypothetical protein
VEVEVEVDDGDGKYDMEDLNFDLLELRVSARYGWLLVLDEGGEELNLRHTETRIEVECLMEACRLGTELRHTVIDRWDEDTLTL